MKRHIGDIFDLKVGNLNHSEAAKRYANPGGMCGMRGFGFDHDSDGRQRRNNTEHGSRNIAGSEIVRKN